MLAETKTPTRLQSLPAGSSYSKTTEYLNNLKHKRMKEEFILDYFKLLLKSHGEKKSIIPNDWDKLSANAITGWPKNDVPFLYIGYLNHYQLSEIITNLNTIKIQLDFFKAVIRG